MELIGPIPRPLWASVEKIADASQAYAVAAVVVDTVDVLGTADGGCDSADDNVEYDDVAMVVEAAATMRQTNFDFHPCFFLNIK